MDCRIKSGNDEREAAARRAVRLLLRIPVGALPAVLRDVEDHAVRVLELPLEVAFALVAEIEEELAAGRLDPLLRLDQIVDLDAEVVGADESRAFLQV